MPRYDRPAIKARIVAAVAAGETVAGVCRADASAPCAASVVLWARADPLFAGELAAARRRGAFARRAAFDADVAAAFLGRVAAGERVNDLLARPGMPSQAAYRHWRRTQPEFLTALVRLRAGGYSQRSRAGHPRYRAWDEPTADRILLAVMRGAPFRKLLGSDPALPCLAVAARWRAEQPDWDAALRLAMRVGRVARERSRSRCTPELTEAISQRIVMGASLRSLARQRAMPCAGTLYAWVERFPAFAAQVARAGDWREVWYNDQMIDICQRNGPLALAATRREVHPLQWRVNQLAKRPGWKRAREAARAAAASEDG